MKFDISAHLIVGAKFSQIIRKEKNEYCIGNKKFNSSLLVRNYLENHGFDINFSQCENFEELLDSFDSSIGFTIHTVNKNYPVREITTNIKTYEEKFNEFLDTHEINTIRAKIYQILCIKEIV